jgi:acetoin utilization deacetylase AcuC-like enzyme
MIRAEGVGFIYSPEMTKHEDYSLSHPEQPARITSIYNHLKSKKLLEKLKLLECPKATMDELKLVHPSEVIDKVFDTENIKEGK